MSGRTPSTPSAASSPGTPSTSATPTVTRRTLLTVAAASAAAIGPLATACGSASGQPAGKVAVFGDSAAWSAPMAAAGQASRATTATADLLARAAHGIADAEIKQRQRYVDLIGSSLQVRSEPPAFAGG